MRRDRLLLTWNRLETMQVFTRDRSGTGTERIDQTDSKQRESTRLAHENNDRDVPVCSHTIFWLLTTR